MKHLLNTCKKSLYWKWADFEISHAYMFGKPLSVIALAEMAKWPYL